MTRWRSRKLIFWALLVVSLAALVSGAILVLKHRQSSQPPRVQSSQTAAPSAIKPTKQEIDNYTVAPDLPRYIYLPTINISKARIYQLGIDAHNQIRVPGNVNDTGWYKASAKPGQAGAMFIYGHVSSWQAKGAFYDLHKLRAGDEVSIERGDGQKYNFKVDKTKIYPANKVDMTEILAPVDKHLPGLNLMTCAGTIKPGTSEFTERLVVFLSLKSS
jgi:sortase (surface protein transpeptidase)